MLRVLRWRNWTDDFGILLISVSGGGATRTALLTIANIIWLRSAVPNECPKKGVAPAEAAAFPNLEFLLTCPGLDGWS